MPGKETEGISTNEPAANKASEQTADPNFADNMGDIKPEYRDEAEKAYRKNVGSNKDVKDNEQLTTDVDSGNRIGSN